MRRQLNMYGIIGGLIIGGLVATPRDSTALGGIEGTFEYAFDAPWRMEPYDPGNGQLEYGAIPIQISIHDAMHAGLDPGYEYTAVCEPDDRRRVCQPCNEPGTGFKGCHLTSVCVIMKGLAAKHDRPACVDKDRLDRVFGGIPSKEWMGLGNFCRVTVRHPHCETPDCKTTYGLQDLAEVEMAQGAWPWPTGGPLPSHDICRAWAGEDCEAFRDISPTSEWHAVLWHTPSQAPTPGSQLPLEVEMQVTRRPWIACDGTISGDHPALGSDYLLTLRNHVRVYFGDSPLPRFDRNWLYGDLHYHSQGTDNDGESAYNYRGVIRAMGAIGIDFLFATEHASYSEQIIDTDLSLLHLDRSLDLHDVSLTGDVLRDMSVKRFAFNRELIYGNKGVNQEAALNAYGNRLPQGYLSHGVVPQIFLGGEIDVIPEVDTGPFAKIFYGNGLSYDVSDLCGGWNSWLVDGSLPFGSRPCNPDKLWEATASGYLMRDVQGINESGYGREHMIYLPSAPTATAFIPSRTSKYGGARRRLVETHRGLPPVLPEIEQKGYAFIAHHLNAPEGTPGPDGPPWSQFMLRKAWASPAVLGLEFWNENERRRSKICALFLSEDAQYGCTGDEDGYETGYERDEITDQPISKIIGVEPDTKAKPINARRAGFERGAGGFELIPFNLETGEWGERSFDVEHALHHGAFSWDMINHWGLDLNRTRQLGWLAPGQPRRFFMAGGSDAHGDLNYRREGYFLGTTSTNDTAIGKPRNLVLVDRPRIQMDPDLPVNPNVTPPSGPRGLGNFEFSHEGTNGGDDVVNALPHTQGQIIEALREGRFSVTDGPALRIAIDQNRNNTIDAGDVQMGGIVQLQNTAPLRVLVEWRSTPEFGPVTKIDLYVGVQSSRPDPDASSRTYAPQFHGIRDCDGRSPHQDPDPPSSSEYSYTSEGRTYTKMQDGYWLDDTLRISPRGFKLSLGSQELGKVEISDDYTGTGVWILDLDRFEVKQGSPGGRFFIRAFAQTVDRELSGCARATDPISRYAFTNPIWVIKDNAPTSIDTMDPAPAKGNLEMIGTTESTLR